LRTRRGRRNETRRNEARLIIEVIHESQMDVSADMSGAPQQAQCCIGGMMRELTSADLDRLRRSNRRLLVGMLVTVGLITLWLLLLVAGIVTPPVIFGPLLGLAVGALLVVPQRRLLRKLGVSTAEAREILELDRKNRKSAD
jgi:hypothetical protein